MDKLTEGIEGEAVVGSTPLFAVAGVSMTFPGTKALDHVDFDIRPGEIHAIVGQNGSGKSTLIKCLSGYHSPDPGAQVWWQGEPGEFGQIGRDSTGHGQRMRFVHQNLGLVDQLSIIDNFALHGGYSRNRMGSIDWKNEARVAHQMIEPFGIDLDLHRPISEARPVERTIVAIAVALRGWEPRDGVLVLDEPTAVLSPVECQRLFETMRNLRAEGAAILYVSHRLQEIFDLADRVTVLRDGIRVDTREVAGLARVELIELMLGAGSRERQRAPVAASGGSVVLEVADLRGRFLRGASFDLHEGEVLGIAGLPDDGRDELPRILSDGVPYPVAGRVRSPEASSDWVDINAWTPRTVALVPPDRQREGVIAQMDLVENVTLSTLGRFGPPWWLKKGAERQAAEEWVRTLEVRAATVDQLVDTLSGGNQQKVLIGRSLAREPRVLVMCEPTAGVDIGARRAIFDLVAERAASGLAVLVATSDIDDLIGLCSRVLVLRDGVVADVLTEDDINEYRLIHAMEGFVDADE
jgi:ABC-type sugar transport system ATPase subunit